MRSTTAIATVLALCLSGATGCLQSSNDPESSLQAAPKPVVQIVDRAPGKATIILMVKPAYPPEAARKGIHGVVNLSVLVGKNGHVKKIRVESGPGVLADAAEAAVRRWVYKPTLFQGKPIEVETGVTIVFELRRHGHAKSSPKE